MRRSEAVVRTESASKYLQQLCKHFAHKVPVEYDPQKGFADFPFGKCHMTAAEGMLTIYCESPHFIAEKRMHHVIRDHLIKFAWREKIDVEWKQKEMTERQDVIR